MPDQRLKEAIRTRLQELGISAREASRRAGKNLGYVGDILDGRSKAPEGENILRLAQALDMEAADLLGDSAAPRGSTDPFALRREESRSTAMVPLYAAPLPISAAFIPYSWEPISRVQGLPAMLDPPAGYAVTVPNNMNAPRYLAGETIYVKPGVTPKEGDFVFVRRKDGMAGIGRMEKLNTDSLTLCIINGQDGESREDVALDDVESVHWIRGNLH